MVEPADPPGRRSRLAPVRWRIRGQALHPGAGGSSPTHSIDGGGGTLNAQRHAAAGGGHAAGVERIGDRREAAQLVGDEEMGTRWHPWRSEAPGRPTAHRRPAGRDVDELESLEGQRRRRWVVELDQLVARARAAGHHLADDEVIDGRQRTPDRPCRAAAGGREQADAMTRRGRRSGARHAAGGWEMDTAEPRGRRRRPPQDAADAYRTLSGRLPCSPAAQYNRPPCPPMTDLVARRGSTTSQALRARRASRGGQPSPSRSPIAQGGGFLNRIFPPAPPLPGRPDPLEGFTGGGPLRPVTVRIYLLLENLLAWIPTGLVALVWISCLVQLRRQSVSLLGTFVLFGALIGAGWFGWQRPTLYGAAAALLGFVVATGRSCCSFSPQGATRRRSAAARGDWTAPAPGALLPRSASSAAGMAAICAAARPRSARQRPAGGAVARCHIGT